MNKIRREVELHVNRDIKTYTLVDLTEDEKATIVNRVICKMFTCCADDKYVRNAIHKYTSQAVEEMLLLKEKLDNL